LGPPLRPAALRRYALGLADRSALRQQAGSVWPNGHPAASLGRGPAPSKKESYWGKNCIYFLDLRFEKKDKT